MQYNYNKFKSRLFSISCKWARIGKIYEKTRQVCMYFYKWYTFASCWRRETLKRGRFIRRGNRSAIYRIRKIIIVYFLCDSPDVLVLLYVDLVELSLNRRYNVIFHFHGDVLRQDRQQEALLKMGAFSKMKILICRRAGRDTPGTTAWGPCLSKKITTYQLFVFVLHFQSGGDAVSCVQKCLSLGVLHQIVHKDAHNVGTQKYYNICYYLKRNNLLQTNWN